MVMFKVNVFEAKAKLSEFLDRAARGERIVICRHNRPIAELRPVESSRSEPRPIGPLPGEPTFEVPASFFEPLSNDELDVWDGIAPTDPLATAEAQPARPGKVAETKRRYGAPARRPARRRS